MNSPEGVFHWKFRILSYPKSTLSILKDKFCTRRSGSLDRPFSNSVHTLRASFHFLKFQKHVVDRYHRD